jgi:hypothetical protein
VEDSWSPSYGANGGTIPPNDWVDLTPRTRYQTSIKRGKQYELDQVQAGELNVTLNNSDGALDPLNGSGPWAGKIRPYQPFRHRMQSSATVNMLPQPIASGGEGSTSGTACSTFGLVSGTDSTGGSTFIGSAGSAFEESSVFVFAVPSGTTSGNVLSWDGASCLPGQTYTFQLHVANVTASTSVGLRAYVSWILTGGSVSSPVLGTVSTATGGAGGYLTLTVTATAPANAFGMRVGLMTSSTTTTAACSLWVDGLQLEKGSSASAFVYPGYWYGQFAGFVERWTPQYQDAGTRAEAAITAVDAFALFSQRTLADIVTEEVLANGPNFYYPLSDPQGSTTATDALGLQRSPGLVGAATGSYAFGSAITATDPVNGIFSTGATVLTVTNGRALSLNSAGITGPANAGSPGEWSRTIAFRWNGGTIGSLTPCLWSSFDTQYNPSTQLPSGSGMQVQLSSTGVNFILTGRSGTTNLQVNGSFADGNWHQVVFGYSYSAGNQMIAVDNTYQTAAVGDQRIFNGLANDTVGAAYQGNGLYAANPWQGDLASVAEFTAMLSSSQVSLLYTAWRLAGKGDSTDQRYARILRYIGYTGQTWLDSGSTRSMGPADFAGSDALSALQSVVDTETGSHWIQGSGTVRFRSRLGKYLQLTPTLTFGEGSGEIPYEDIQLDFDPTHLANVVQVTQSNTGQVFSARDQTSITNYFQRLLTRSVNTTSAAECQDCASYLLSRYKDALMRVSSIKVNVSATAAWSSLLPLELGTRIRVMRRPLGCPPIQVDCFIEQIQWDYDIVGNATLTMQLSPADARPSAIFTGWRTTLAAATSVGATSISVNAPTFDNQTPLAAQVGVGQQIVVGQGGAAPETMTVKAVSATSPGWTTGTITFTAAMANSHTAGISVTGVLPAGNTNPATWDLAAVANSINFAY